jgi:hypothetical protein
LRSAHVESDRFVEQQVAAGPGGTDGETGLYSRGQGNRDSIDGAQELVEVVEPLCSKAGSEVLRFGGVPAPYALEGGVRRSCERRRVD